MTNGESEEQWRSALQGEMSDAACRKLLESGADVNFRTTAGDAPGGDTPLILAAEAGDIKACRVLIAAGAKVELGNEHGRTALHVAAANGHVDVCNLLLRSGAPVDARTTMDGGTPLHWAAHQPAVIDLLLAAGAPVHAATDQGFTPLWEGVSWKCAEGCAKLLAAGADPFLRPEGCPVDYLTPFEKAVVLGSVRIAQLLSHGREIDVHSPSKGDMELMELARGSGNNEMLEFVRSLYAEHAISEGIAGGGSTRGIGTQGTRCSIGPI